MNNKNNDNTVQKYMMLYMSLGICFGLPIGMCIGMAIGEAKDKRLSENIMIIRKIETVNDSLDIIIYVIDKNEIEKQYIVTDEKMKEEKFVEGDRVAEEIDGSLVSLESK